MRTRSAQRKDKGSRGHLTFMMIALQLRTAHSLCQQTEIEPEPVEAACRRTLGMPGLLSETTI